VISIAPLVISIIAVVAVIYREWVHDLVFKPKLGVTFSLEEPISRETKVNVQIPALEPLRYKRAFWPRLRVKNNGRSVARRCEGILAEVTNPKGEPDKRYDPLALKWAIAPSNRGFESLDIA